MASGGWVGGGVLHPTRGGREAGGGGCCNRTCHTHTHVPSHDTFLSLPSVLPPREATLLSRRWLSGGGLLTTSRRRTPTSPRVCCRPAFTLLQIKCPENHKMAAQPGSPCGSQPTTRCRRWQASVGLKRPAKRNVEGRNTTYCHGRVAILRKLCF